MFTQEAITAYGNNKHILAAYASTFVLKQHAFTHTPSLKYPPKI